MFSKEDFIDARSMYDDGSSPADILRHFATRTPSASTPDLMQLMMRAFSLTYEDVQCIGGWWHDGTEELSDEQLNNFLGPAIRGALRQQRDD